MDAWSVEQLKKMQAGGNGALNDFFKQYGVDKYTDIRDKYNNRVAEVSSCPGLLVWQPCSQGMPWYPAPIMSMGLQDECMRAVQHMQCFGMCAGLGL